MRSILKRLFWVFLVVISFSSCDEDENKFEYAGGNASQNNSSTSIKAPSLDKILTTTDLDGFSIRLRFANGGDVSDNMKCTVHWAAYSSKPSKTPKKSDLTRSESMRQYASTKTKTTFDKSHAGYNGGTYIYYYAVCSNSKYSTTTDITYTIVRRGI